MELNVTMHYPNNDKYDYGAELVRCNLDEERIHDLETANGFIVTSSKPIKDDVKDPNGIFSTRFGMTLQDVQANATRYKCKCGTLISRIMCGQICPVCGTPVKFVDDNFSYFGWIALKDPYYIIHPVYFNSLSSLIGAEVFNNIIKPFAKKDEDGHDTDTKRPKNEPFYGIGMVEFHDRFDEIMDYYKTKCRTQAKNDMYYDIISHKNDIFSQSMPVFTTLLRPFKIEGEDLHYEKTNAIYKIAATLAEKINKDNLRMTNKSKNKNELLYDLQMKYKELYQEINAILSGKKGTVRQLYGGRFNFTARSVIVPDPSLRLDQVKLSYPCLCGLLQQRIINVLKRSHNMSYHEAYIYLDRHSEDNDRLITMIIEGFITHDCNGKGIPVLINRNPTISYGGILQVYVVGIAGGFCMNMPLTVLTGLAADFDGDSYVNGLLGSDIQSKAS